jgi:hypothetical protein
LNKYSAASLSALEKTVIIRPLRSPSDDDAIFIGTRENRGSEAQSRSLNRVLFERQTASYAGSLLLSNERPSCFRMCQELFAYFLAEQKVGCLPANAG